MKKKLIILLPIAAIVILSVLGAAMARRNAVLNNDAIIVETESDPEFEDPYIYQTYEDIDWKIGRDVAEAPLDHLYECILAEGCTDVYEVEVYNSDKPGYKYYMCVKAGPDIVSVYAE